MLIQKNDIFELGSHYLACGDALDPEIVKMLLGDRRISLILTDMPYGVGYVENKLGFNHISKSKIIANDHEQTDQEYRAFTKGWLSLVKLYLAKKNSYYLFNSDKMLFAMREGLVDEGFKFAQLLIWVKNHVVLGRLNYLPQHELIAYGWYGRHAFQKSQDKSVLFYPKPNKSPLHPTMKPVGLLRNLILNSSKTDDWVYDPFLGSGSTLMACEQTRRRCLGIELDPEYCQVIIDRFEKVTNKKAKKL
ncbi:MAG: site-specific DNA-methyltransferase [bacterium]|nr:site-specific DNA-methyltransferase [bacterium]